MQEPVTVCSLAATGDAYSIFAGGLVVPPEYNGILYQGTRGLGKLSPGTYNAAIVLQSLANYDGTNSTLYWCRRGPFEAPLLLDGLPDPGDVQGRLAARLSLTFEVVDPAAALAYALRDRSQYESTDLVAMVAEDVRSLLDPIVACETRENLFRPSIFHETAALTISDWVNNLLKDKGIRLQGVSSIEFEMRETPQQRRAAAVRPPAAPVEDISRDDWRAARDDSNPSGAGYWQNQESNLDLDDFSAKVDDSANRGGRGSGRYGSPIPQTGPNRRPNPGQTPSGGYGQQGRQPASGPYAVPGGGGRSSVPPPPQGAPSRMAQPAGRGPGPAAPGAPPVRSRPIAPGVESMRRALAQAFLTAPWNEFAHLHAFDQRRAFLRALDPELLLSNDKIGELANRINPESFDLRWATVFFTEEQCIFKPDEMRRFQQMIAALSMDEEFVPGGQAMLDQTGRAVYQPSSSMELEAADPGPERPRGAGDKEEIASLNATSDGSLEEEKPGQRRPPSYLDVDQRVPIDRNTGSGLGYEANPRNFREQSQAIEDDVVAEESIPFEDLGEIEAMLNGQQPVQDKKVFSWVLVLNNKTAMAFSRVKISMRSDSLVTAGYAVLNDFAVGSRRTIDLRLARAGAIHDSRLRITAIGFAEGGALPYVFSAGATVDFKPAVFGKEHVATIKPDDGNYKMLSSSDLIRYSADVAETQGPAVGVNDMRLLSLKPDEQMTAKLRTRNADIDRGVCPICENETSRKFSACQVCGATLPRWFGKEPVLLVPERSNARARVDRAMLWMEGDNPETAMPVVLGHAMTLGRRHDNDFILRVYGPAGKVDERRTTELSRQSAKIEHSQGVARMTCLNRHGIRFHGKFAPCNQTFDLPDDARYEFLNRQGEPVVTLSIRVVYGSGPDDAGTGAPLAIVIEQDDPRRARCVFLLRSVTFAISQQGALSRLIVPSPAQVPPSGQLVFHDECLWLAPETPVAVFGERSRDRLEVLPNQLLRFDDNARIDFRQGSLRAKVQLGRPGGAAVPE